MAVQTQIQTRRGTAATWTSTNPTLAAGEIGFETDTNKFKIGTGSTAWTALAYAANTSPLTTKGDLYTYSTTNDRLPVGPDGSTVVADSSASTGLRYQGSMNAGKNAIINGGMDIWQRGTTSGTVNQAKTFLADRFYSASGNAALTYTATQSTDKPDGFRYSLKLQRSAGNTTASEIYLWQDIETFNSIPYAGKTVTVSFYAKKGANFSAGANTLGFSFRSGTGTDQTQYYAAYTGQADVVTGSATLTTSWQRFSFTGTVATTATELGLNVYYTASGTAGADDSFFITGVQVEVGSVATNFTRTAGTIQGELAACQRYYYRQTAVNTFSRFYLGNAGSTTVAQFVAPLPVTMRTSPTALDTGGSFRLYDLFNAPVAVTSFTILGGTETSPPTIAGFTANTASGLTAIRSYTLTADNSATAYLGFSAEL